MTKIDVTHIHPLLIKSYVEKLDSKGIKSHMEATGSGEDLQVKLVIENPPDDLFIEIPGEK